MSTIGLGAVVGVPVVAAAGAAVAAIAVVGAAVAVGGVGVVVAQQAGRAVLACGREMKAMAEQNRAMQRSLQEAALRYEEKLSQQERERERLRSAELQQRLEDQRETVLRRQERMDRMRQAQSLPPEIMIDWDAIAKARAEILAGERPPATAERHRISGWEQRLKRVRLMTDGLHQGLEYFVSGPGQGLFVLAGLREVLQDAEEQLRKLEDNTVDVLLGRTTVPASDLESLLVTLEYIDDRLQEMRAQELQKHSQRQAAMSVLERANQVLEQAVLKPETANYLTGVEMLQGMLDEASAKLEEAKFERARSTAEAVLNHLEHIEATVTQQRQKNLYVLMQTYRSKVDPLQQLPELAGRVARWQQDFDRIAQIAVSDIERAWTLVTKPAIGLFSVADELQREALSVLLENQSNALGQLSQQALQEMGYEIARQTAEDGTRFIEGRLGKQRMYITFTESGEMVVKADGFGDASCQPEMQQFLQIMQDKGIQGAWQEKFILTDALQRMLRLLQEAGLNVKIEPTDDGVTVLASGALDMSARINYDGQESVSAAMLDQLWQREIQQGSSYADIIREMDDERQARREELNRQRDAVLLKEKA